MTINNKQTFSALNSENQTVFASQLSPTDRGKEYFCVECGQRKYYTHGEIMKPHFRNCSDSNCKCTPESNLHKTIKLIIEKHFGSDRVSIEYSSHNITKDINRRADVFLHDVNVVFEIQVSPITREEYKQRTIDWNNCGCEVVWIQPAQTLPRSILFNELNINRFYSNLTDYHKFFTVIEKPPEIFKIPMNMRFEKRLFSRQRLLENPRFKLMSIKRGLQMDDLIREIEGIQSYKIISHYDSMECLY